MKMASTATTARHIFRAGWAREVGIRESSALWRNRRRSFKSASIKHRLLEQFIFFSRQSSFMDCGNGAAWLFFDAMTMHSAFISAFNSYSMILLYSVIHMSADIFLCPRRYNKRASNGLVDCCIFNGKYFFYYSNEEDAITNDSTVWKINKIAVVWKMALFSIKGKISGSYFFHEIHFFCQIIILELRFCDHENIVIVFVFPYF